MNQVVWLSWLVLLVTKSKFYAQPFLYKNTNKFVVSGDFLRVAHFATGNIRGLWSYIEGIPQNNAFFVEQSDSFNYRANERCLNVPKSSPRKIANQMMDLMKNLEGEETLLINNVTSNLIRSGFTSRNMQIEPELEQSKALTLKKEFDTFPKIAALVWLAVTDPVGVKQSGWCSIKKLSTFLSISKPVEVVNKLQTLDQSISEDIRLILDNFIKSVVWPLNKIKRPSLELTKFYKSTKRPKTTSTTEMITVADADRPPLPRSIMHLEADSEDSDEESTEIIKIPIVTPTPTGGPSPETLTFRTHPSVTTPVLRTMLIHTTAPYVYTEPAEQTTETRATVKRLIVTDEEDSDSESEIDIMTKSPYKTKLTTVDDGFFIDEDIVTRRSTHGTHVIEHVPVSEEPLETSTPEEIVTQARTTKTTPTEAMPAPTTSGPRTIMLPEEDSKEESDTSAGSESKESKSGADESVWSADNSASVVLVTPAPAQRRANLGPLKDNSIMAIDLDGINAKPKVVTAVTTIKYRPFTEDDTQQFMKLVSVDEDQLKAVNDHLDRSGLRFDHDNSNIKEYPVVLVILLLNVIFLL